MNEELKGWDGVRWMRFEVEKTDEEERLLEEGEGRVLNLTLRTL